MRWRSVQGHGMVALALAGVLATAACSGGGAKSSDEPTAASSAAEAATAPSGAQTAAPSPSVPATVLPTSFAPAASAGGICTNITFDEVQAALGLQFEISAASGKEGDVRTCVLLPVEGELPALTFVSTPVDSDETADDYNTDFVPKGADDQDGLGRAGYSRVIAASGTTGPTTEIGWLGQETAYTLSVAFEPQTGVPGATAYIAKLVALAPKLIDD